MTDEITKVEEEARRYYLLAHPLRLRLIRAFAERELVNPTVLEHEWGLAPTSIQRHMRILRAHGAVCHATNEPAAVPTGAPRRYYRLTDPVLLKMAMPRVTAELEGPSNGRGPERVAWVSLDLTDGDGLTRFMPLDEGRLIVKLVA